MDTAFAIVTIPFVFALGAAVGSFLNVVIYRLPEEMSLLSPPSHCPHCHHVLGKTENVPIAGWLWLRGRCRWCQGPISIRYPAIELLTALLFSLVFWQFGATWTAAGYGVLVAGLIALAWIDLDTLILPGPITRWGLVAGAIFHLGLGVQDGSIPRALMASIVGAVAGIWLFDGMRWGGTLLAGRVAMGGGDPKFAAAIGAWLGLKLLLVSSFLACGLGALVGGGAIALGWVDRKQPIPFGPFLAMGALLAVFWGNDLMALYLKWFFPLG